MVRAYQTLIEVIVNLVTIVILGNYSAPYSA